MEWKRPAQGLPGWGREGGRGSGGGGGGGQSDTNGGGWSGSAILDGVTGVISWYDGVMFGGGGSVKGRPLDIGWPLVAMLFLSQLSILCFFHDRKPNTSAISPPPPCEHIFNVYCDFYFRTIC